MNINTTKIFVFLIKPAQTFVSFRDLSFIKKRKKV